MNNLSEIMSTQYFRLLNRKMQNLFSEIYDYAKFLETENKNLKKEIKRMSKLVNYGYKLKKRREEVVKRLSEKNRVLEEEVQNLELN